MLSNKQISQLNNMNKYNVGTLADNNAHSIFCQWCGTKLFSSDRSCPSCGGWIKEDKERETILKPRFESVSEILGVYNSLSFNNHLPKEDEYVEVFSCCPNKLNLSTQKAAPFKKYIFQGFGDSKKITVKSICEIIENHPTFSKEILFVVMNKDIAKKYGLHDIYEKYSWLYFVE